MGTYLPDGFLSSSVSLYKQDLERLHVTCIREATGEGEGQRQRGGREAEGGGERRGRTGRGEVGGVRDGGGLDPSLLWALSTPFTLALTPCLSSHFPDPFHYQRVTGIRGTGEPPFSPPSSSLTPTQLTRNSTLSTSFVWALDIQPAWSIFQFRNNPPPPTHEKSMHRYETEPLKNSGTNSWFKNVSSYIFLAKQESELKLRCIHSAVVWNSRLTKILLTITMVWTCEGRGKKCEDERYIWMVLWR